jgi:glycosyltransferase involved in cell wall biosynthesis
MDAIPTTRLVMLGAAPETRGSISAAVSAYREHGLFKRWPIDYFAARGPALRHFLTVIAQRQRFAVHAHLSTEGFWRDAALLTPALAARAPVLLQLHGGGFERFYDDCDPAARALIRGLFERAGCVIVPCESMRAWVRATARNAHVKMLPAPVSFEPLAQDPCRPNLVLFLGHLAADKGIFDLLEAIAALRHDVPDVRLVCAGDGNRIAVARYAERLGIAEAVKFTGWVGPCGKRALFESAAVLAAPAYDAALPVSLLEAMAAGVPVVASAVGGMPEVIVDGVTGVLIAPGDNASLTRNLRKLLVDRNAGQKLGSAARDSLRLRFSPERALPMLEELYACAGVRALPAETVPVRNKLDLREAA